MPQGSVLGPNLSSLFCNDLPAGVREFEIQMYGDDTTIDVAESSPDKVVVELNSVPQARSSMSGAAVIASYPTAVKLSV